MTWKGHGFPNHKIIILVQTDTEGMLLELPEMQSTHPRVSAILSASHEALDPMMTIRTTMLGASSAAKRDVSGHTNSIRYDDRDMTWKAITICRDPGPIAPKPYSIIGIPDRVAREPESFNLNADHMALDHKIITCEAEITRGNPKLVMWDATSVAL